MAKRPAPTLRPSPRPPRPPATTVLMDEGHEAFIPYRDPDASDEENEASARLGIAAFEAGQRQAHRRKRLG